MHPSPLTDLQLAVMQALWELEAGTAAEVHAALQEAGRDLAITTVATMLQRLEKQGWVDHTKNGRQFVYRARVPQQEAASSALRRVVDAFFGGSAAQVTAQLLETDDLSHDELAEMRRLLRGRSK